MNGAGRRLGLVVAAGGTVLLAAARSAVQPHPGVSGVEQVFDSVRHLRDQIDVTRARMASRSVHGVPLDSLVAAYGRMRAQLVGALADVDTTELVGNDRAALARMDTVTRMSLKPDADLASEGVGPTVAEPDCGYDPAALSSVPDGLKTLTARVVACYGAAAAHVVVGPDTLDRLTIFGLLRSTPDPARRERLFRALEPVWRSVDGDDGPSSPYRRMVVLRREAWAGRQTPMTRTAAGLGLDEHEAERWLTDALRAWRGALPDSLVEPWDYYWETGADGRILGPGIPRDSLLSIVRAYYRSLGANLEALGVHYDIEPRPGKYPVAYTTFGARPVERGGRWVRAEPWVFASYHAGGFGNLEELVHETGHAIHIAAIRARPAFADWPDSDIFTEALADVPAVEAYEPAWQRARLGDSVPLVPSLRSRYGSVMLDMAWSLFEIRVHRPGAPPPNQVWTEITRDYLGIRPHPELSWWAMRGQLIDSPGYMLTYGLGAFLVADLRAEARRRYGDFARGDTAWYGHMSQALYRFGHARPAAQVIRDFLGRNPTPEALLEDLGRIGRAKR